VITLAIDGVAISLNLVVFLTYALGVIFFARLIDRSRRERKDPA